MSIKTTERLIVFSSDNNSGGHSISVVKSIGAVICIIESSIERIHEGTEPVIAKESDMEELANFKTELEKLSLGCNAYIELSDSTWFTVGRETIYLD